jgi:tRNA (uracil-5-)-methyltransferase TRM9
VSPETEKKIIQLNKEFYDKIGRYWNNDAKYYWNGWEKLIEDITIISEQNKIVTVLELGCGNGRFVNFLSERFPDVDFVYTGIDISNFASVELLSNPKMQTEFKYFDLLQEPWPPKKYDIVVAFGLIHHIPGINLLNKFFENFTGSIKKNGIGIFTTWQYMRLERLKKRIVVGEKLDKILLDLGIKKSEFRENDNILDWVSKAEGLRFSHFFDESEVQILLEKNKLKPAKVYLDDDRDKNRNQYFVVKLV